MKATLEFDLNDSEDLRDYTRINKSLDMAMALWEITHNTKKGISYQLEGTKKDGSEYEYTPYDVLDLVYDKIYEILEENNINIDKLID